MQHLPKLLLAWATVAGIMTTPYIRLSHKSMYCGRVSHRGEVGVIGGRYYRSGYYLIRIGGRCYGNGNGDGSGCCRSRCYRNKR